MQNEIVVRSNSDWWKVDIKELWQYHELLYIFVWRDIKVRYKQTMLGILWVLLQPMLLTGIFSIFFGKIAKIPSGNLPYPVFAFIGLTIWNFFSAGVLNAGNSLLANGAILKKIYFPRLLIPLAAIATSGVDFFVTLIFLALGLIVLNTIPTAWSLIVFPLLLIILSLTIAGLGLFTAALNIKYRDFRFIVPFFIQVGLFVSPVIYPLSVVYDYRRIFLIINPLTSVIENSRAVISGTPVDWWLIPIGIVVSAVIFIFGFLYFRKTEAYFADIS